MTDEYSTRADSRQPIVGVMGSGREEHPELTGPLGEWIAGRGCHLLTGGGGGVMVAVSRSFYSVEGRLGRSIGVLPGDPAAGEPGIPGGYPNPWVEIPVRTHLPLSGERGRETMSRNHLNVLTADAIVALPGGAGTRSEVELALEYRRPLMCWLGENGIIAGLEEGAAPLAGSFEELADFLEREIGPPGTA